MPLSTPADFEPPEGPSVWRSKPLPRSLGISFSLGKCWDEQILGISTGHERNFPFFDRWIPIISSPCLLISLISLFWKLVKFTDIQQTLVKMHFMANLGCLPVWFYHSFFFLPLLGWDWTPEHGALSPWFYRWWYSLIYSLFSRFSATVKISHFAHLFELSTASLDTQPDKLISLQCVEPGHCWSSS